MATVDLMTIPTDVVPTASEFSLDKPDEERAPGLHRIRTVRLQQGASLRSIARRTGVDVRQLRLQENEAADIRLSDLHKWQRALDVPLTELLAEPDESLAPQIKQRARLVRLMKTVVAIRERAKATSIQRMAQMLAEQLVEIMPELEQVGPWHEYGQRRSLDECGRIAEQTVADDLLA